jgi:predicted dehydrogenase
MNSQLNRRSFLKSGLAASAALSLPARLFAQAPGANNDIRVAVIGFNGRGADHISNYLKLKGVRIVALCDVDAKVLEKGKAQLAAKGTEVTAHQDIRKLLESKEVDAISIATPNHWHSLAAIWGLQAGKDVYVEKPVSHNVWEGRQLVKAADAHQRIVQMGVQSRSGAGLAGALEWLKSAPLGKLKYARGLCYKPRPSIGKVEAPTPWPEEIDKDLWFGPAEVTPLMRKKLHYDWHWVWNTGNGDVGNQGIHQMDIARRFTGEAALAPAVWAVGGRVGYVDDGETPNSLIVFHDYPTAPLIFEVRGLPKKAGLLFDMKNMDEYRGASVGVVVQYENGYVVCPDYNNAAVFDTNGELLRKYGNPKLPKEVVKSASYEEVGAVSGDPEIENHYANFLKAVRSRKVADLNGKIIDGHISSGLCHTGNISYRLGKQAAPGVIREKIQGNKDATDSFDRLAAHLEANGLDPAKDPLVLGEFLKMDPKTEQFAANPAANALLKRTGRAPFTIPEKV